MAQPRNRSYQVGQPIVFADYADGNGFVADSRWSAKSIEIGSGDRPSAAIIEFDRVRLLRDPSIGEPLIEADARFQIGFLERDAVAPEILFEGIPVGLIRTETGAINAQSTTGQLQLRGSDELFRRARLNQIDGAWLPRITDIDSNNAVYAYDEGVNLIFNPDGLPNRSLVLDATSGFFDNAESRFVHYLTSANGFDIDATARRVRARFWTYAQAIAHVVAQYTNDIGSPGQVSNRGGIKVDFGTRGGGTDSLWDVIAPLIGIEPPDDDGNGIDVFDVSPNVLLTQKCDPVDLTGLDVIGAVSELLRRAGIGWFFDIRTTAPDADTAADLTYRFRLFSPGGQNIPNGIGGVFLPKLEPYNVSLDAGGTPRDAEDYLAFNILQDVSANYDFNRLITSPLVRPAPTRYEITVELRPFWRPITSPADGSGAMFLDNINASTVITDPRYSTNGVPVRVLDAAIAEMNWALQFFRGTPSDLNVGNLTGGPLDRVDFIAEALDANGKNGVEYYDVLRKWGIPTDWGYADDEFARDTSIGTIPPEWGSYKPFDFATSSYLTQVIPGADEWPTIRRPFLPLLIQDAEGQAIPPIVEISFDAGENWHEWKSVTISPDDSVLWLNFDSPIDCRNPKQSAGGSVHIGQAYLRGTARVRVTCSIEGSDPIISDPPTLDYAAERYRVVDAGDLRSEICLSQYADNFVSDVSELTDRSLAGADPDSGNPALNKFFLFTPRDVSNRLRGIANRIQARASLPTVAGTLKIPWIELDVEMGSVVPRVDDVRVGDVVSGLTELSRNLDFTYELRQGYPLAPSIAGITYNFTRGGFLTSIVLNDWREIDGASETGA